MPPTRPCGKQVGGFPPLNPTHAQESSDKQATFPRITLTRLSIHREGHRNKEAKRHRSGAARQSKLCAARQGPALHLEESEQRAGEQPFCRLPTPLAYLPWAPCIPSKDIQRIQEPPPPQFSHSYTNIHRALTLRTGIVLNTFHEFSFNSHNTPLTQAFPSPLTYTRGKLKLTEANGLPEVTRLAGGRTQ